MWHDDPGAAAAEAVAAAHHASTGPRKHPDASAATESRLQVPATMAGAVAAATAAVAAAEAAAAAAGTDQEGVTATPAPSPAISAQANPPAPPPLGGAAKHGGRAGKSRSGKQGMAKYQEYNKEVNKYQEYDEEVRPGWNWRKGASPRVLHLLAPGRLPPS